MTSIHIFLSSLIILLSTCATGAKKSGFDLDVIEEKIGTYLPTGFSAFGALVAIKIKKILLVLTFLLGTVLTTKLFSGLWPLVGHHHHCPYKPVFIKEVEYERPHFHKDYESYEEHFARARQEARVEDLWAFVGNSLQMMHRLLDDSTKAELRPFPGRGT